MTKLSTNLLNADACMKAIESWTNSKKLYDEIEKSVDPKNIYCFNKEDLEWVKSFKGKDYFYLFSGIYEKELIFIVTPIDDSGKVIKLNSYLYLTPKPLEDDIVIVENITMQKKTTLTKGYFLCHETTETINLSSENDPSISEEKAIIRIKWWLEEAMDWFYYETNKDLEGKRIFNSFKVPLFDLNLNKEIEKIYCIFGFKRSHIHNMIVPVINFIAVNENNIQQNIISSDNNSITKSNIRDFSSPCPPFCKESIILPYMT